MDVFAPGTVTTSNHCHDSPSDSVYIDKIPGSVFYMGNFVRNDAYTVF